MANNKPHPAPPQLTLRAWKAGRAGSSITVHGVDIDTAKDAKITNVIEVLPPDNPALHECVALDKHGTRHRLVFA